MSEDRTPDMYIYTVKRETIITYSGLALYLCDIRAGHGMRGEKSRVHVTVLIVVNAKTVRIPNVTPVEMQSCVHGKRNKRVMPPPLPLCVPPVISFHPG